MSDKIEMEVNQGAGGTRKIVMDLPSNSKMCKAEKPEKKVEKIIKGEVVQKKKTLSKKFFEVFTGDDVSSVSSYILYDVLIPAAKSAITDMVQGGIEMVLYGERKGSRTQRDRGRSYVSYNNYSSNRRPERNTYESNTRNRARHNFDDIILSTRGEAEDVLSHLVDLCIDYGQASVSDLYDLVGITGEFTDNKYGWYDLGSATVSRTRDGYLLNLPKVNVLD